MFIDTMKALGVIAFIAAAWWFWTVFLSPMWDALYPLATSYSFGQDNIGTLNLVKTIWQNLPLILSGAVVVWLYFRAQRREPDQYYVQP